MTKEELLKRVANAYDMGLFKPEVLRLLDRWTDGIMRLEGGQFNYFAELITDEQKRTEYFRSDKVLANDEIGYAVIHLVALLRHPCQKCAIDPQAWHTRSAFCEHREKQKEMERFDKCVCGHDRRRHTAFSGCLGDDDVRGKSNCGCDLFSLVTVKEVSLKEYSKPIEQIKWFDPTKEKEFSALDLKKGDIIRINIDGYPPEDRVIKRIDKKTGRIYLYESNNRA